MKFSLPVLFTLSFCFNNNTLTAQRWNHYEPNSFDLIYDVEYGHRLLSTDSSDPSDKRTITERNNSEREKTNWRIGFNYNYLLREAGNDFAT